MRKLYSILVGLLLLGGTATSALAALAPAPDGLGIAIEPHGFPAFFQDTNGLQLEPCLPAPAGNATRGDLCIFDPPAGSPLEVGSEIFWWMAEAEAPALVAGGKALLTLALEGAFTAEEPVDGQQMTFGRVRIRVDVPTPGTYTVTHPFGTQVFENVTVEDGINITEDIGAINILFPELAFRGALGSSIGPFLTWPDFDQDPTLQVLETDPETGLPTGTVLEQYVGDPNVPHVVTGGPNGNLFRIQGPNGLNAQTELFTVMGKVYDPSVARTAHIFPDAPTPNLFAVGPVNRETPINPATIGEITGIDHEGYPVGYPLWYQDAVLVTDPETGDPVIDPVTGEQQREGGLQLTICPATDPMCISAPIDPADPESVALRTGEEGFWWSGEAFINEDTTDLEGNLPANLDGLLVLALEAAFGGPGVPAEGQQIGFARVRIRIDTPVAGTYTVTHPYGTEVFENVAAGRRAINITRDVMITDPADPDGAFNGALYGDIGPSFLTWDTFNPDPLLNDPALVKPYDPADPLSPSVLYIGDPVTPHAVAGSPSGNNFFRIRGPNGIDVRTRLFTVTGKVYDPQTFEVFVNPDAPVASPDEETLNLGQASSVTIAVLDNDTFDPPVQVTVLPAGEAFGPADGTATVNPDGTVTYTPNAGFDGVDTFAYQITDSTGLTSANALVTVTVVPVETITVRKARLELRRLRWDIQGTNNFDGTTLSIRAGSANGDEIGTAIVNRGRWSFRGTSTANPNVTTITVVSPNGPSVTQPLQVR
ncbi:hypothetical protein DESUT3_27240 [Desulfuromonas versatilis]|uniref:Tandem-95 repeat protein n=1 Tax=Desulfuromonas versatilis TaxID=2802975 RepID=A0ABM8HXX4_9BACT|nr:Ig-like domain-containing protein [Desulfuromonas versatilis]BCR05655.1 hypothetical protein DESUT3_27240 [Desulfuromonas versatilis]